MLHGEIKVNGSVVAEWSAVRLEHPPRDLNDYKVEVTYCEPGEILPVSAKGTVQHHYGDGVLVLTGKVMAWAAEYLYPKRPMELVTARRSLRVRGGGAVQAVAPPD